ncbi:hypothetical protein [Neptuniibacter halophilus]|uniref:hypothetical protein n=1 Tax=Neptuniibacter halophilus TaxID=651666 RepID=UPI0025739273|nr:hypothetical protein [Neptuniibacter halophilus]
MANEYRPFFSRKHISALMWFSLLAILLLSTLGPGDVEYYEIEAAKSGNLYWMEMHEQPETLAILLPTPAALNPEQRRLQQLKTQILQTRLQQMASPAYSFNVAPRQDRIEITLRWASDQPVPDLKNLWRHLSQPVESARWHEALKKIEARQYLQSQSEEQQLIDQFFRQLQPETRADLLGMLATRYHQLFTSPRYAVSGEQAEEVAEQVQQQLPTGPQVAAQPMPRISASSEQQSSSGDHYRLLLGSTIVARIDPGYQAERIAARVLQDLLSANPGNSPLQFRLLWSALQEAGYRALLVSSQVHPESLLAQLQQQISDELIEHSQNQLAAEWQERMREPLNQQQALNQIAFYGLPTDSMAEYSQQLLDQEPEQIREIARRALQSEQQIRILHSPRN